MKISKILDVKTPRRGTTLSAGIDFFVPKFNSEFISKFRIKNPEILIDDNSIVVKPHERVNIPSGIKANIPKGHALIAYNKSGISLKYGLDVGATVVDEDYQGEIHISLCNTSNKDQYICPDQKIIQFLLIPINDSSIEEVNEDSLFDHISDRGQGAYGSTGER